MWSFTGASSLAIAVVLGACASEPDAVVTVIREHTDRVTASLCEDPSGVACPEVEELFADGEPMAIERTIGIYLDVGASELTVMFSTFASANYCQFVTVPFDGPRRDPTITLPDSGAPSVADCPGCDAGTCNP